jgi:hypothetical protein
LTVIGPPHHPHRDAASLRAGAANSTDGAELVPTSPDEEALGSGAAWGFGARTHGAGRRDALRRLPMPAMVRMNVPADVTPMRHDGSARSGA